MTESFVEHAVPPLDVLFQPIVALEGETIFGYRALPRSTAGPHLEPRELLDRAARAGTVAALDQAWRRVAIERIASWDPRADLRWFLSVDGRCGDDPCFGPRATRHLVEEHRLVHVVLEVALGEPGADRAARIAGDALPLALAGFGTGHVTQASLRALRPAYLMLDGDLVRGMALDPLRATLVRTIAELGARVGFEVVAQGIESESDLDAARRAGARYGQGSLLGHPAALPIRRAA